MKRRMFLGGAAASPLVVKDVLSERAFSHGTEAHHATNVAHPSFAPHIGGIAWRNPLQKALERAGDRRHEWHAKRLARICSMRSWSNSYVMNAACRLRERGTPFDKMIEDLTQKLYQDDD